LRPNDTPLSSYPAIYHTQNGTVLISSHLPVDTTVGPISYTHTHTRTTLLLVLFCELLLYYYVKGQRLCLSAVVVHEPSLSNTRYKNIVQILYFTYLFYISQCFVFT